jgi:hypothetical protein
MNTKAITARRPKPVPPKGEVKVIVLSNAGVKVVYK